MKNSLINRGHLRTWLNVPVLLLTAFCFLLVAGPVMDALARKTAKKWRMDLIERVNKY